MKRAMALILAMVLLLCVGAVACAETNETRASNYFSSYGISLSKPGGNKINITFTCSCANGNASQIGVSSYSVQKYDTEAAHWYTVSGPHNGSYSYNAPTHSFAKTFQGASGEKYRVKCTFTCSRDGTFESKNYTSGSITLP